LDGCSTIRAFNKENYFSQVFCKVLDINTSALMNFMAAQRWSGSRIQSLGSFAILVAAMLLVALNDRLKISTGIKAMLLIWSAHFTISLGFLIQALSESEASMTSIERIMDMSRLPQERDHSTASDFQLDDWWPSKGDITFSEVCLRYRPGLPLALDGLSFSVRDGQRCGIVGRTGAGKSTISVALFRLTEIERGCITLDGIDLSKIGLADVRGRDKGLYIIPQDPVLFSGSIRDCLDPFQLRSDDEILNAISLVKVGDVRNRGVLVLDDYVEEGGRNFSLGERQLLCLARAILAKPKVLILDEATASVDLETDAVMQRMIRDHFPGTTILTIAHRLKTIMDYDVILVMEEGRAKEFGSPRELLNNKYGVFSSLVDSTGMESSRLLRSLVA
jgi:ABC-type multidrug transport system fused ATPase/permease subunit